jgi:hypothetical protein
MYPPRAKVLIGVKKRKIRWQNAAVASKARGISSQAISFKKYQADLRYFWEKPLILVDIWPSWLR